jgi:hypothetical protein
VLSLPTLSVVLTLPSYPVPAVQRFESRVVIPIQYCTFALSTIIGSAVLYRDFEGLSFSRLLNFVFGCLVCGAGVYLLTRDPSSSSSSSSSPPPALSSNDVEDNHPASPVVVTAKPIPFPSIGRSFSGRLLPLPVTAAAAKAAGGRKASFTLGSAYLLAGSPTGREEENEEEDEGGDEAERNGNGDGEENV